MYENLFHKVMNGGPKNHHRMSTLLAKKKTNTFDLYKETIVTLQEKTNKKYQNHLRNKNL